MNVALILVSLGIATEPEPLFHPLLVASFMKSCVGAANHAELRVAGAPGRSLNTWAQFVCVQTKKPQSRADRSSGRGYLFLRPARLALTQVLQSFTRLGQPLTLGMSTATRAGARRRHRPETRRKNKLALRLPSPAAG